VKHLNARHIKTIKEIKKIQNIKNKMFFGKYYWVKLAKSVQKYLLQFFGRYDSW